MWWAEVAALPERLAADLAGTPTAIDPTADIETGAVLDDRAGPIVIGARTRVCTGAIVRGPAVIGSDCLIGNYASVRGPVLLGHGVRLGFATEVKQALIGDRVSIGPQCFVADSRVDEGAYLGAQVRTSNHRLDQMAITVRHDGQGRDTGLDKLGCWIGKGTALGIQVIVLPGRVVPAGSTFEPRLTIARNHPPGHYRLAQRIECISIDEAA